MKISGLLCAAFMVGLAACAADSGSDLSSSASTAAVTESSTLVQSQWEVTPTPQENRDAKGECVMEVLNFERDGKKIYGELYLPAGDGPFPAVIMAHGFGGQCAHNRPYAEVFAQNGIAAYIFDFIGGGNDVQSGGSTTEMSVLTEAADMTVVLEGLAAMEQIDRKNIFLAGQSQGGFVASYIAGTQPEKVRGLVAIFPAYVLQDDARKRTEGRELP